MSTTAPKQKLTTLLNQVINEPPQILEELPITEKTVVKESHPPSVNINYCPYCGEGLAGIPETSQKLLTKTISKTEFKEEVKKPETTATALDKLIEDKLKKVQKKEETTRTPSKLSADDLINQYYQQPTPEEVEATVEKTPAVRPFIPPT